MNQKIINQLTFLNDKAGEKFGSLVRLIFIGWAFAILGWCLTNTIDRYVIPESQLETIGKNYDLYTLIMFTIFPMIVAILCGYFFRKLDMLKTTVLYSLSVVVFIWLV